MKWTARLGAALVLLAGGPGIAPDRAALTGTGAAQGSTPDSGLRNARKLEAAALESANLYLQDKIYTTSDFLDETGAVLAEACQQPDLPAALASFCARHRLTPGLILRTNAAAFARAAATTDADHAAVIVRYEEELDYLGTLQRDAGMDGWIARAKEGIAYARLKRGELGEARSLIDEAKRLDRNSSMVGTTAIKIGCAEGADPRLIRAELRGLRRALDSEAARVRADSGASAFALRNAPLERRNVEGDAEMFEMCRHAGLRPLAAAALD
jgi:hypothetical protein